LPDLPPHQLDWYASPDRVVYFGYGVCFAQQLRYRGTGGGRGHGCPVGDIDRGESNARKLGACFHFDAFVSSD